MLTAALASFYCLSQLGKPSWEKSAVFFNIVLKAFDPLPLSFEHYVVNFSEGILTKVRKRLSQQLLTKWHVKMVKMLNLDYNLDNPTLY